MFILTVISCLNTISLLFIRDFLQLLKLYQIVKAIPNGLVHLMKCHLSFEVIVKRELNCLVDDKCIYDPKCSNKIIRNVFQSRKIITPRGFFFLELFNR